jgi:succinate-acetate transporter protein
MRDVSERTLGYAFGLLGGLLIALGALVALVTGAVDVVLGRAFGAVAAMTEAVIWFVIAALALFFAYLGQHPWRDRPIASGVVLVVVALIGWGLLGLGTNLVSLVGTVFVLLAGVLYLVIPAQRVVRSAAASA